ncbi:hypothetical protein [uncultured Modestobacter sp.]|uniref:hypothetical protein n=1 Tax=uncultured Modestobacter sp. TaxID=380048 RepID=UPI002613226B|nr:hypothetical protein [uncultured Modestobacter sp.]
MPDLATVLALLVDAPKLHIFKGLVCQVGTGQLIVYVNGDVVEYVPHLASYTPVVGEMVYVAAQEGFGWLVLGSAVPRTAAARVAATS